ncbi:MAG TPA: hypothetical protein VND65_16375 [Candidatus Binatia bacterium]|nr:hypothetical protein [Candidatus Binatia bacterium]
MNRVRIGRPCLWLCLLSLLSHLATAQADHVWKIETVNNGGGGDVGRYASLAIDSSGSFHIGYYDASHGALLYSFRSTTDKQWYTTQVEAKGAGTYASIAVDASGQPHFAYNSPYEDGLHYAMWDGKKWHKQIIDSEHINYYTSIQLDSKGHPRISYYLYHAPDRSYLLHLKFASFDGQNWTIETVDKRKETGKFNSLALDSAGNPRIAYSHVALGDLLYAAWDGSRWNFGDADSRRTHNDYVGIGNSIALDRAGQPRVAYLDSTRDLVKYAWIEDGRWKAEEVEALSGRGEVDHVSLQLDSHDKPHLAYYDGGSGVLKYATRDEKGWHVEVVDSEGNVGKYPSLCLTPNDEPYIAYYALDAGALRMAHREASPVAAVAETK